MLRLLACLRNTRWKIGQATSHLTLIERLMPAFLLQIMHFVYSEIDDWHSISSELDYTFRLLVQTLAYLHYYVKCLTPSYSDCMLIELPFEHLLHYRRTSNLEELNHNSMLSHVTMDVLEASGLVLYAWQMSLNSDWLSFFLNTN